MQAIGILYPGDMGHNVGRVLKEDGFAVVTTLVGRSARTRQLSAQAAITELDSLLAVVEQADIVLSIIPPTAAQTVSHNFAYAVQQANRRPLFVDANAVSPMTVSQVGETIRAAGCDFLDACIIGPARDVRGRCTLYVSGPHVREFESALGQSLRMHPLGDTIGQASAFKMLFSGLNKGLVAVLSELTVAAQEYDCLDDLLACYTELFPGIMQSLEWLVPTYPFHAARRAEEMRELAETLEHLHSSAVMARGTQQTLAEIGRLNLSGRFPENGEHDWTLRQVLEALGQCGALKRGS